MKKLIEKIEKKASFVFKTIKQTGNDRVTSSPYCDIKIGKKTVGGINNYADRMELKPRYKITFLVRKGEGTKWITLSREFESIDDAKKFITENKNSIFAKFDIAYSD